MLLLKHESDGERISCFMRSSSQIAVFAHQTMFKLFWLSVLSFLWGVMTSTMALAYQAGAEVEEYDVYSAALNSEMKSYNPNCTKLTILNDFPPWDGRTRNAHHALLKHLKEGVRDDFEAKNKQPYKLKNLFDVSCPYALVSIKECQELARTKKKKEYKARCPDTSSMMTLSRVGFSQNMDQALMYISIWSNRRAELNSGYYYLLVKENGKWTIREKFAPFKV